MRAQGAQKNIYFLLMCVLRNYIIETNNCFQLVNVTRIYQSDRTRSESNKLTVMGAQGTYLSLKQSLISAKVSLGSGVWLDLPQFQTALRATIRSARLKNRTIG